MTAGQNLKELHKNEFFHLEDRPPIIRSLKGYGAAIPTVGICFSR